mmetsp:Transcript_25674/g.70802  ORF Transcript_25674/g.70802 Transcript_25674/m.70802 type:complete len:365 (+) Transcript_25674:1201-2295(+)|eukprot:CAMPEP_0168743046 /NCGR_PEP_ID=MMETSP0724-20121128/13356_1 /TAXON_ID=265536 /ORGANISM="Amphiprora sp., Strain CCMP467" /LENGTH=364 /DNA_ID=CAMNT_0008790627 /DNA_START=36 /DNA_END=1130 /DNA_ORIENTATION=-
MASLNVGGPSIKFKNLLVVIKQTAYEEYSQLKLRGVAPKALRWKRLEQRYRSHKQCVTDLLALLREHHVVQFSCVNRVDLDRQHLSGVDLIVAVGGDGTVLSSAHFVDHGTIPLLGINSDPNKSGADRQVNMKKLDERRSHGALCMFTADDMESGLQEVLYGGGHLQKRTRLRCKVKSTFAETQLVPALNDLLIANPSPAAVSRFRMGWMRNLVGDQEDDAALAKEENPYGTVTRFGGKPYDVFNSLNVWSSGMWVCTATGSTAAMAAAGGMPMPSLTSDSVQYLIREHMREKGSSALMQDNKQGGFPDNGIIEDGQKLHIRWNSQTGRIFVDGSHLTHHLELGDEILIDNKAPPLLLYGREQI